VNVMFVSEVLSVTEIMLHTC